MTSSPAGDLAGAGAGFSISGGTAPLRSQPSDHRRWRRTAIRYPDRFRLVIAAGVPPSFPAMPAHRSSSRSMSAGPTWTWRGSSSTGRTFGSSSWRRPSCSGPPGFPYSTLFEAYDIYLPRVQVHTEFHYPPRLDDQLQVAAYFGRIGHQVADHEFRSDPHRDRPALRPWPPGAGVHRPVEALVSRPLPAGVVERLRPFALSVEEARAQLGIPTVTGRSIMLSAAFSRARAIGSSAGPSAGTSAGATGPASDSGKLSARARAVWCPGPVCWRSWASRIDAGVGLRDLSLPTRLTAGEYPVTVSRSGLRSTARAARGDSVVHRDRRSRAIRATPGTSSSPAVRGAADGRLEAKLHAATDAGDHPSDRNLSRGATGDRHRPVAASDSVTVAPADSAPEDLE